MFGDYSKLVTLYKIGEPHFRFAWHEWSNICTKKRAAHAARLFFLVKPIKSLICGVVIFVPSSRHFLNSLKRWRRQRQQINHLIGSRRKNNSAACAARFWSNFSTKSVERRRREIFIVVALKTTWAAAVNLSFFAFTWKQKCTSPILYNVINME